MRIAINALLANNLSGTGKYSKQLIKHLARIDEKNEYIIFAPVGNYFDCLDKNDNFRIIKIPFKDKKRLVWEQFILPLRTKFLHADLLHSLTFVSPYFNLVPSVVTIHDMAFRKHAWTISKDRSHYYDFFIPRSIKTANRIIAVSEFTKTEIVKSFPGKGSFVSVTPEGIDNFFQGKLDDSKTPAILDKYKLKPGFILSVGTIEPRKNYARLLDAYHMLVKKKNIKEKLVIVGRMGWDFDEIQELSENNELKDRVVFPGFITPEELAAFYSQATIFVLPSLYEGFGLPILEAMTFGLPLITSNISALPEVAGDAAIFVNPYNRREIANAMFRLLRDETLKSALSSKSLERVKYFNWKTTAIKTLQVYKETTSK